MNITEAKILQKLKGGNEEAYVQLFRDYYIPLCIYARRYLGRRDLAEDIVSDTFFNIWRNRNKLEIKVSLKSYLFQAVCKNSLNYLRKTKKEESLEGYLGKYTVDNFRLANPSNELPSEHLILKELGEKIGQAVDRLPKQQQIVFRLKRYEGKKNREIAELMRLSEKTVEMHLHKANLSLRTHLKGFMKDFLLFILLNDFFFSLLN